MIELRVSRVSTATGGREVAVLVNGAESAEVTVSVSPAQAEHLRELLRKGDRRTVAWLDLCVCKEEPGS